MSRRPPIGEPPPYPYISTAHRTRRLAAGLMLYGVTVLVAYVAIRVGTEWIARVFA